MLKQIKSHWYYVFWGIATVSVVAGQVYVGTGYREMANEVRIARESTTEFVKEMTGWMPWVNWD
tara:strand:- start:152 stop:343 length:192 start_codon:yes stop_codon:yes gene_type:complete